MSSSRKLSPARSQGAIPTPRCEKPRRTRSVGSPALPNASGRLSSIIKEHRNKNVGSLILSPLLRKSVLTDNTDIEELTHKNWWKKLDEENSRDVMEVLEDNNAVEVENIFEELGIEVLSPEKKNYSFDIPDSSDNESIKSIVLPQRKLFAQKENLPQKKFGDFGTRETLDKLYKTNIGDNTLSTATKVLFQSKPRSKPIFPAALLNISPNSTTNDKTLTDLEPKEKVRNIFGNRQSTKRKNMFANFIASESEDEIPEIQVNVFGFQKSSKRRPGSLSRGIRDASPTSSLTTDMELDDWKLLPSSTMVETQLDIMIASGHTPKKARLCKLSEGKESDAGTSSTQTNKSKTITKEKSPELDSSISTRNKSKTSQDEEMPLNKSQGSLNKSQTTSLRNNDSNISQSSILTRSRNKSGLVDAQKNMSINKSQNSTSKIKNYLKISLKQTENDGASDINNLKLISKNVSKIHSFSQNQNVIVEEEQNSINVTEAVETIAQNEEEEFDFTLEYENDSNADEIDVVEKSKQKNNSIINKSKEINVSSNTSKKDVVNKCLPKLTNKTVNEFSDIANQDGYFNGNNTKENPINSLQNENIPKVTADNDNHEETSNEAENNKDILGQRNQSNNKEILGNKSQNRQDNENNKMEVNEAEQNISVNVNQEVGNKSQAKDENKEINQNVAEKEKEQKEESHNKTEELENGNENCENREQNQEIAHESDQEIENLYFSEDEGQKNKILENKSQNEEMKERQKLRLSQDIECVNETNESKEGQMERQEVQNESREVQSKSQKELIESQEELNESQDKLNESEEEPNDSQEIIDKSDEEHNKSQEIEDASEKEHNESQEERNESEEELNKSQEIKDASKEEHNESQEEINESQEIEGASEEEHNESQEERNESEEELNKSQEIEDASEEEHNESQEVRNETEEQDIESEAENEDEENNESQEVENESENEQQNISQEQIDQNESEEVDLDMEIDARNESVDNEAAADITDQDESQENDKEAEIDQNEIVETPNVSHDTTGRNRKKDKSPEVILHDTTNQTESFAVHGRNTSVRKSKSMIKNLNIRPSFAPDRESTGLSDGTKNSSAEGSGWDSHRTTRKTLRQTFGKDFSPRKSLRALVMEKSANKRQTEANDITSVTSKFPLANSTEFPEESTHHDDFEMNNEPQQSDHEASRQMRQTTLEMYLQKIKQQNMENRIKVDEAVRNSLKVKAPPKDIFNPFKVPARPMFPRKTITKTAKPKAKPSNSFLKFEDLPEEVKEDMKYKPPKRFQPSNAAWITKRLYKYLETKLEPKYDYKARIRAEKLVENLYNFTKELRRRDVASTDSVDVLKHEFARLNIVKTHFEFYDFFHEFMPREIRIKVIPDVVNKIPPPRRGIFSDIL